MDESGSQPAGFRFFAVAGGKRVDFTTPFVGKLESHMAKSANANDSDPGRGKDVIFEKGGEYRHASAEQGSSLGLVQCVLQRTNPRPLHAQPVAEAPLAPHKGALAAGCKM